ncbi:hypothetical protein, partial [Mycobacterium kansasii]
GVANSGDVNTGAFISGSYSNGLFWRGDHQGLIGISYALVVPEIPIHAGISIPVNIPFGGDVGDINIPSVTIPQIQLRTYFLDILFGGVGPITTPPVRISGPEVAGVLGGPMTSIDINIDAGVGPVYFSLIDIPAAPGFGNSTSSPSSGFFNSGTGSVSGFGNFGVNSSGWVNFGSGSSGVQNVGALQSGLA